MSCGDGDIPLHLSLINFFLYIERYIIYIYINSIYTFLKNSLKNQLLSTFQLTILDLIPSPRSNPPLGLTLDFQGKPSGSRHREPPLRLLMVQPEIRRSTHSPVEGAWLLKSPLFTRLYTVVGLGISETNKCMNLPNPTPIFKSCKIW